MGYLLILPVYILDVYFGDVEAIISLVNGLLSDYNNMQFNSDSNFFFLL